MPILTDFQNGTINLLDYLYFHDIVALQTFSNEKLFFYEQLVNSLLLIVEKKQYKNFRAEHYQHLLLVGIDLNALYIHDPSGLKKAENEEFIRDLNEELCCNVTKAGFCLDNFEQDLNYLLDHYPLVELSRDVLYKIVSQILSYQFDSITICVLSQLIDYKFFISGKYVQRNQVDKKLFLDRVFFRAMLFLEYEAFKNNLLCSQQGNKFLNFNSLEFTDKADALMLARIEAKELNTVPYKKIYQIDLNKKNDLKTYLADVKERLGHNALLTNHLANWVSLIGAWHVMYVAKTNTNKTIYRRLRTKCTIESTCCEIAQLEMNKYGFIISERSLYDSYNYTENFYQLIGIVVNEVNKSKLYGALEPVLTHFFFYDSRMGTSFKNALEEVNIKLKNKKAKT